MVFKWDGTRYPVHLHYNGDQIKYHTRTIGEPRWFYIVVGIHDCRTESAAFVKASKNELLLPVV